MKQSQGRPWKWHRLAHVCRKWRDAVFSSPRRLGLKILCEYGAPVESILTSWPTLPLVAKFNTGPKLKHIPKNVIVALRLPDRLCEIDLHVTSSMLASIVEVAQKPCQALESIRITVEAPTGPSILIDNVFLGGSAPHLREIKLDGIAFPFPAIRQVLSSTKNLVELHLGNIPNDAYFSPNELVTGLSTSIQLKRLTVDFHSPASSPPPTMTRPLVQHAALSSLASLDFHGTSRYLEEFVAQIELPALKHITIRLFNDISFEIPEFCKIIYHLNALRSPTRVIIKHNVDSIGVHFKEGNPLAGNCFLGTSCRQLDWQLSFATEITSQLSFLLASVHSLDIRSGNELPTGEEDVDSTEWAELFQLFTHVTKVYVSEKLVPNIVPSLVVEDMTAEVLPDLTSLQLRGYRRFASVAEAAEKFVTTRRLSGRTVCLTSGDEVRHYSVCYTITLRSGGGGNNNCRNRSEDSKSGHCGCGNRRSRSWCGRSARGRNLCGRRSRGRSWHRRFRCGRSRRGRSRRGMRRCGRSARGKSSGGGKSGRSSGSRSGCFNSGSKQQPPMALIGPFPSGT